MGADYYIETYILVNFKDAARESDIYLLNSYPSWADNLIDGQELERVLIYKDGCINNIDDNIINYYQINILDVDTIYDIMSVRERM
jgi:hypothetical protein